MVGEGDQVMQQLLQVQKQETKLKPSQILRQTKCIQYRGHYGYGNVVCALGAIARFHGWDGTYDNSHDTPSTILETVITDPSTRARVTILNDDEHKSFSEIADWLEERGL